MKNIPKARQPWLERMLPACSWLPSYQKQLLRPDVLAGATVWAVTVPEAIAYAQLAGVPAQMGLFAAPFLMLGYMLFGTSRQLMVGATSASAIMLATTVADVGGGNGGNSLAVVLSLVILIYRASRPQGSVLGRVPGTEVYRDSERHPENQTIPGLLIFRLDAPLFFANSALTRERVLALVRSTSSRTQTVLLDLEASNDLDVSSADMLAELTADLKAEGIALLLANVRGPVRDMLQRSHVLERIGEKRLFLSLAQAVAAFQRHTCKESE